MFEPTNEQGTVALFCSQLQSSRWEIVSIGMPFPDAILRRDGEEWRVEFEFKARNFVIHAHDFRECDLIVCWQNDFAECPIPVLELSNPTWIDAQPLKGNPLMVQVDYWRSRAQKAESQLGSMKSQLESTKASLKSYIEKQSRPSPNPRVRQIGIEKQIVRFLKNNPGAKLDDIAAHADTTKGNVSKKITSLVEIGVLHEERQGNRRVVKVNGNHEAYLDGA